MSSDVVTAERFIPVRSSLVFALVSDAGKHQAIDGSGTLRGTGSQRLQLGSTFGMQMHWGASYRTVNRVVEYEQDRSIAWQTTGFWGLVGGRVWRYELTPVEGGTQVRESWDISRDKQRFFLRRSSFPGMTRKNMARSLDRIAELLAE